MSLAMDVPSQRCASTTIISRYTQKDDLLYCEEIVDTTDIPQEWSDVRPLDCLWPIQDSDHPLLSGTGQLTGNSRHSSVRGTPGRYVMAISAFARMILLLKTFSQTLWMEVLECTEMNLILRRSTGSRPLLAFPQARRR